jgi:hypothetical protein
MTNSALQTLMQESIHKLIVFIFWAHLVRGPPRVQPNYGDNTMFIATSIIIHESILDQM